MSASTLPYLLPKQGEVTVCEVSCRIVHGDPDHLDGALLGLALPDVQVDEAAIVKQLSSRVPLLQIDDPTASSGISSIAGHTGRSSRQGGWGVVSAGMSWLQSRLLPATITPPSQQQLLHWSTTRPWLAVADPGLGAVCVYDLEGQPGSSSSSQRSGGRQQLGVLRQPRWLLLHELHRQVSCVAWRPVLSSMLAVGVEGGVALWSLAPSLVAAGPAASSSSSSAGLDPAWATFLPHTAGTSVVGLAWSPDGRHLAGSSAGSNRLVVWDVALGVAAPVRVSLACNPLLSWSPDGNYLLTGGQQGYIYLLETTTWSVSVWQLPNRSCLLSAAWAPNCRVVLLALSGGAGNLVALHLVAAPPCLTSQMLPVALPEVAHVLKTSATPSSSSSAGVTSMVWDPSGQRLAVALGRGPEGVPGCHLALYSTSYDPVVHCSFLGFIRPFDTAAAAADRGQGQQPDTPSTSSSTGAAQAPGRAPASSTGGLSMCFASACCGKASAVLSMQDAEHPLLVRNIPLYI